MTTDPVQAGIMENWPFLRSAEKCFFWPKVRFFPKNTPKICEKTDIYFGKRYFFLCTTFSGLGQNMAMENQGTVYILKIGYLTRRSEQYLYKLEGNIQTSRNPFCRPRTRRPPRSHLTDKEKNNS